MADNEEFIADPTGHLIAIIDEASAAAEAERSLAAAGFTEVHVYRGADGVENIDSSGSEHGAGGGLIRGIQQASRTRTTWPNTRRPSAAGAL